MVPQPAAAHSDGTNVNAPCQPRSGFSAQAGVPSAFARTGALTASKVSRWYSANPRFTDCTATAIVITLPGGAGGLVTLNRCGVGDATVTLPSVPVASGTRSPVGVLSTTLLMSSGKTPSTSGATVTTHEYRATPSEIGSTLSVENMSARTPLQTAPSHPAGRKAKAAFLPRFGLDAQSGLPSGRAPIWALLVKVTSFCVPATLAPSRCRVAVTVVREPGSAVTRLSSIRGRSGVTVGVTVGVALGVKVRVGTLATVTTPS